MVSLGSSPHDVLSFGPCLETLLRGLPDECGEHARPSFTLCLFMPVPVHAGVGVLALVASLPLFVRGLRLVHGAWRTRAALRMLRRLGRAGPFALARGGVRSRYFGRAPSRAARRCALCAGVGDASRTRQLRARRGRGRRAGPFLRSSHPRRHRDRVGGTLSLRTMGFPCGGAFL